MKAFFSVQHRIKKIIFYRIHIVDFSKVLHFDLSQQSAVDINKIFST